MTTQEKLIAKYGHPLQNQSQVERNCLTLWDIPYQINAMIPALPNRLYCNVDAIPVFLRWFERMVETRLYKEIKTFDGCYCPRYQRGSDTMISIHSWGLALDLNASQNPLNHTREQAKRKGLLPFSPEFVTLAEDCGLSAGMNFKKRPDGMHYQYTGSVE
jgi:hypothetical protein